MNRLMNMVVGKYWHGSSLIGLTVLMLLMVGVGSSVMAKSYSDIITSTPGVVHYWRLNETGPQPLTVSDSVGSKGGTNYYGYPAVAGAGVDTVNGPRPSSGFGGFSAGNLAAKFNIPDKTRMVMNDPNKLGASKTFSSGTINNITMSFWLKLGSITGEGIVAGYQDTAGGSRYVFTVKKENAAADGYTIYVKKSNSTQVTLTMKLSQNLLWHHMAVTWDGTTIKGYWDGALINEVTGPAGALRTPTQLVVGGDATTADLRNFNGSVDEFALFDRTLSASEISKQYSVVLHTYDKAVYNLSPMHYWRFSETNGTSIADSVGTKSGTYTAILGQSGPRPSDGFLGFSSANFAPSLNGVSDSITFADPNKLGPTKTFSTGVTNITIVTWFRTDDYSNTYQVVGGYQTGLASSKFAFLCQYLDSNNGFNYYTKDSSNNQTATTPGLKLTDTGWHMLAWSWDGTTMRMYLDGGDSEKTATGSASGALCTPEELVFGKGINVAGGRFVDGQFDEIAIFDKTLTAAEITGLYDAALDIQVGTLIIIE